jgi:hypothetical protein
MIKIIVAEAMGMLAKLVNIPIAKKSTSVNKRLK